MKLFVMEFPPTPGHFLPLQLSTHCLLDLQCTAHAHTASRHPFNAVRRAHFSRFCGFVVCEVGNLFCYYYYLLLVSYGAGLSQSLYQLGYGWMTEELEFDFGHRQTLFFSPQSRPTLGPIRYHPPDSRGLFPGVKRLGNETHRLPASEVEVRNMWSYTSTHPCGFMP
jgi:hypothetical protein